MAETPIVDIQLRDGAICASRQGDIIRARGIRYAHASRFQPPQPVRPWMNVVDCTQPASICPQVPSRLEALNGPITTGHTMDEDCLHVSVCAPADTMELRPVIVFIHGGGYTSGGGDLDVYSGADLAAVGGVVQVSVTYRLGILGYQPIDGVAPANLGLLDQIAALRWVRDNISSFGGDPRRVTLAGSSAGADSIYCLFAADGAKDLFQRAILQSTPLGVRNMDRDAMVAALQGVAKSSLSDDPAGMPLEELFEVQKQLAIKSRGFAALGMPLAPMLGHAPLAISKAEFDTRVQRSLERVPVFVGYCRDEGVAFEAIFSVMSPDVRPAITSTVVDFISKAWFQDDSDRLWQQAREAGSNPWFYDLVIAPEGSRFGATHTLEMPFLLGGWEAWKHAPMLEGSNAEHLVRTIGVEFRRLWVAFARGEELSKTKFTIDENFKF